MAFPLLATSTASGSGGHAVERPEETVLEGSGVLPDEGGGVVGALAGARTAANALVSVPPVQHKGPVSDAIAHVTSGSNIGSIQMLGVHSLGNRISALATANHLQSLNRSAAASSPAPPVELPGVSQAARVAVGGSARTSQARVASISGTVAAAGKEAAVKGNPVSLVDAQPQAAPALANKSVAVSKAGATKVAVLEKLDEGRLQQASTEQDEPGDGGVENEASTSPGPQSASPGPQGQYAYSHVHERVEQLKDMVDKAVSSDGDLATAKKTALTAIRHGRVYKQAIDTMYQEGLVAGLYKQSHDLRGSLRRAQNEQLYKAQHIIAKKQMPDEEEKGLKARKAGQWKPFDRDQSDETKIKTTGHDEALSDAEKEKPETKSFRNPEESGGSADASDGGDNPDQAAPEAKAEAAPEAKA